MKNFLLIAFLTSGLYISVTAQTDKYWTSGSETIFSFANINDNGETDGNVMRFAPFINVQVMYNVDMSKTTLFNLAGINFLEVLFLRRITSKKFGSIKQPFPL